MLLGRLEDKSGDRPIRFNGRHTIRHDDRLQSRKPHRLAIDMERNSPSKASRAIRSTGLKFFLPWVCRPDCPTGPF